jgi:hypothetical protein
LHEAILFEAWPRPRLASVSPGCALGAAPNRRRSAIGRPSGHGIDCCRSPPWRQHKSNLSSARGPLPQPPTAPIPPHRVAGVESDAKWVALLGDASELALCQTGRPLRASAVFGAQISQRVAILRSSASAGGRESIQAPFGYDWSHRHLRGPRALGALAALRLRRRRGCRPESGSCSPRPCGDLSRRCIFMAGLWPWASAPRVGVVPEGRDGRADSPAKPAHRS